MQTILTKRLLGFLIEKGYTYCLSQISAVDYQDAKVNILLKPVKKHPILHDLPHPYQRYYDLLVEPFLMSSGIAGTQVLVELSTAEAKKFSLA
ncbi:MAG: hypothetical protein EOP42_22975 [Sphingobacteriaceae bacterium]|nr:MAG: hypothetical protein EOP42_22975 [Sphingobacteriaceae bacterium]